MRRLIVLLVTLSLWLTGCSGVEAPASSAPSKPRPSPIVVLPGTPEAVQPADSLYPPTEMGANWGIAQPLVEITLTNFVGGAINVKYNILVHNGDGLKNKILIVSTDKEEVEVDIPLNVTLAKDEFSDIVHITSNLPDEKLLPVSYDSDTKTVHVAGFLPETTRTMKINYRSRSLFRVKYKPTTKSTTLEATGEIFSPTPPDVEKYVAISEPSFWLQPMENKAVSITLLMPSGLTFPEAKWEYDIDVSETAPTRSGISTSFIRESRCLVRSK